MRKAFVVYHKSKLLNYYTFFFVSDASYEMETISEGELSDTRSVNDTTYEGLSTNVGKLAGEAMHQSQTSHEPVVNGKVKITINGLDEKASGIASSSFKPTAASLDDSQLPQPPSDALTKPKFAIDEAAGGLDATTPTVVPMSPPTKLPRAQLPRPSPSIVGDETDYNSPPRKRFSPEKLTSTAGEALSTTKLPRYYSIDTKHFNHPQFHMLTTIVQGWP